MVQTAHHLNSVARSIIAHLLLEILEGEISHATRMAIADMGNLEQIPEPFHHLVSYTQGSSMDGIELAAQLLEELREICIELQENQL
jgi:hypothetical protein